MIVGTTTVNLIITQLHLYVRFQARRRGRGRWSDRRPRSPLSSFSRHAWPAGGAHAAANCVVVRVVIVAVVAPSPRHASRHTSPPRARVPSLRWPASLWYGDARALRPAGATRSHPARSLGAARGARGGPPARPLRVAARAQLGKVLSNSDAADHSSHDVGSSHCISGSGASHDGGGSSHHIHHGAGSGHGSSHHIHHATPSPGAGAASAAAAARGGGGDAHNGGATGSGGDAVELELRDANGSGGAAAPPCAAAADGHAAGRVAPAPRFLVMTCLARISSLYRSDGTVFVGRAPSGSSTPMPVGGGRGAGASAADDGAAPLPSAAVPQRATTGDTGGRQLTIHSGSVSNLI